MTQPLQILLVEDDEKDAALLAYELRRFGFEPHMHRVDTESGYIAALRPDLDLIVSDYSMPRFNGLRALDLMKAQGYSIPFIFLSGSLGVERTVQAIKRGAFDYLTKYEPTRIGPTIALALEQKRLERAAGKGESILQDGERKFRALFDAAHDAIYMLHKGIFVDCNAKGLVMFGRTWDQIVGHTPDEFAPLFQPDGRNSREKALEIVSRAMAGEAQTFEWTSLHADGSAVCSEVSLNRMEMAGTIYLMAVSRDVTERRKAEERMAEQAALLDKARDAIAVRDLEGTIHFWNKSAERLYGWTREEAMGRNIGELLFSNPDAFKEANRLVVLQGEWNGDVKQVTKSGCELTVEARWTLLRDKDGRPKSVLAIDTDVTEKKTMEANLMRAQRIQSIGTLAGGIAHDLNNILTPILTSIEILKLMETDPKGRHILETIEASSRRGADIVRQVLSFARGIVGQRVEVQPKRLLKDTETLIKDTFPKNIHLSLSLPTECWPILGDPTQLHQILLNLSVNARDAMPEGGNLGITAENKELKKSDLATYPLAKPGRYVIFTVSDSGVGIPTPMIDKIFEPFFTTKEVGKGTGLGLSTVVAIVKSHDGFVDVRSTPGRGTVFRVFLPAMGAVSKKPEDSIVLANLPRGNGETVLVVDDEPSILTVTSDTLESFGYRTLTARDGTEAVAAYLEHLGEISVVLTDMTMPNMDGAATMHALQEIDPEVKIIASSGFLTNDGATPTSLSKTKYFLSKPYTAETLLKMMRTILEDKGEPAALAWQGSII